nr:PP2C family serine/threonine-protein phosphatase [uncultured Ruminococcus sp.]
MFFKDKKVEPDMLDWKPLSQRVNTTDVGLSIGSAIYIGKRSSQQDSIKVSNVKDKDPVIAILSDGMGGMADGNKASSTCTEGIFFDFNKVKGMGDYPSFLQNEVIKYDGIISGFTDENGNPIHSGATLIACIIDNDNFFWATVGDSHLYLIRNNEIKQLNQDHNFMIDLQKKVERGLMTEKEALSHPHKDSLISFLGMNGIRMIDMNEEPIKLQKEDMIVICSDGLYRTLNDDVIKEITRIYKGNVQNACEKLISAVIQRDNPSQDNTSVIILKY